MLKKWHKLTQALLGLILLMGMLGSSSPLISSGVARLHPLVTQMAAQSPEQSIRVIVQKAGTSDAAEKLATQLGGAITQDLHIINAFVAEMPARAAQQLATSPAVRWVALDAPVVRTSWDGGACKDKPCVDTSNLVNAYIRAVGADRLWNQTSYLQGQGIAVAVVDSGITDHKDFKATSGGNGDLRILEEALFVEGTDQYKDWYGHGTHVAGIIGGNGAESDGRYIGVAPKVNLLSVNVSDNQGASTTADVIAGLQWVHDHQAQYNIRVVNISLNSSVAESYHTSALNAAVEILWFRGIVVVVSAGNNGSGLNNGILYPPANDPFVITVGATDDRGTADIRDDGLAPFSAYGITESGFAKPDLVAPGTNIISMLSKPDNELAKAHPDHRLNDETLRDYYFRMSGTSMAAPVVSGAIALLLQDEPNLTPDQVKHRLMATAVKGDQWPRYNLNQAGAGYLDIYAAVHGITIQSANTGLVASQLLWTGSNPVAWNSVNWNSVNWNSVNWNSVNWNSVNWNSVNWNSVNWNSDYWGP
jgi:serine protease AprX